AQAQWEEDIRSPQGRARLITADNDESLQFQASSTQSLVAEYEALGGKPAGFHPHFDLKAPFQPEGYVWLRHLADSPKDSGGLLADDMGMGKTIQIIALICHLASVQKLRPL